jgi:hypothetical protein
MINLFEDYSQIWIEGKIIWNIKELNYNEFNDRVMKWLIIKLILLMLRGFDPDVPGWPRYSMSVDRQRGVYNLKIRNVQLIDEGIIISYALHFVFLPFFN